MGRWYSFLCELGQVWVATASLYIATTGVVKYLGRNVTRETACLFSFLEDLIHYMIRQGWVTARVFRQFQLYMAREVSTFRGEYSWLIELKNSHIFSEDSRAVKLFSTCLGRVNVEEGASPGRAAILLTCFIQELFGIPASSLCLERIFEQASLSSACTSFSTLYISGCFHFSCILYSSFCLLA